MNRDVTPRSNTFEEFKCYLCSCQILVRHSSSRSTHDPSGAQSRGITGPEVITHSAAGPTQKPWPRPILFGCTTTATETCVDCQFIPSLVLRLRLFNLCIKGIMQWGCRECTHLVFLKRVLSSLFDYFYIPLQQKWKFVQFPHCFLLLLLLERALSVPRYFLPHTIYFNIHIISCV